MFYLDFSRRRGLAVAYDDGDPYIVLDELVDFASGRAGQGDFRDGQLASRPTAGDTVVLEANFEFHVPARHNAVIDAANEADIKLLVIPLRVSGRAKKKFDFAHTEENHRAELIEAGITIHDKKYDDFNAVEAIRLCVKQGQHLAAPRRYDETALTDEQIFNRIRTGKLLHRNNEWVRQITEGFPSFRKLWQEDEKVARILGNGPPPKTDRADRLSGYSLSVLLVMIIAAKQSASRDEFDRRMGLFAHGYPSIYRSTVLLRLVQLPSGGIAQREIRARGLNIKGLYLRLDKNDTEEHKIIRDYRREARRTSRWVYNWYRTKDGQFATQNGQTISQLGI